MIKCIDCGKPPHPRKQNEDGELLSDKDIAPIMEGVYKPDRYWGRKQIGEKIFQKCFYLCKQCAIKNIDYVNNDKDYSLDRGLYALCKGEEIELTNRTVTYDDLEPKEVPDESL
tara:strand:+ start:335 stop:676 length:342 start_codon:yes stop_codon:yes gene_type:complete